MKIAALMNVWNAAVWLPHSLRSIYPFVTEIVVSESCWVPGEWEGTTSPDGTAALVQRFRRQEDPENKVTFVQAGRVINQPAGRNAGVRALSKDLDWVWQVDADEFYTPEQAAFYQERMANVPAEVACLNLPAKCFYFDFSLFKREHFTRLYRYYPGFRCQQIASFSVQGQTVTLNPGPYSPAIDYFHYSYVGSDWTRIKACMGEDVGAAEYRRWWDEVYSSYDGTPKSLTRLYARNGGGVHVMGGGPLELYAGPHPAALDEHPLRHVRWGKPLAAAAPLAAGEPAAL